MLLCISGTATMKVLQRGCEYQRLLVRWLIVMSGQHRRLTPRTLADVEHVLGLSVCLWDHGHTIFWAHSPSVHWPGFRLTFFPSISCLCVLLAWFLKVTYTMAMAPVCFSADELHYCCNKTNITVRVDLVWGIMRELNLHWPWCSFNIGPTMNLSAISLWLWTKLF